jgi:glucosamine--fructose-6-phosphate aminotransferase (isomerizing)
MCGIIGYVGDGKSAVSALYAGLKKLEYRGYDSCGVAAFDESHSVSYWRHLGAPSEVLDAPILSSSCGIGHTRWATHGAVSIKNAHPHWSCDEQVYVVHNGVIENCDEIKNSLENQDCRFYSETDTEALVNLIAFYYRNQTEKDHVSAISAALKDVEGTYGLAVLFKDCPDTIFAVRRSSPLILGVNDNEHYISSDANALPADINRVVYLEDGDIASVKKDSFSICDLDNKCVDVFRKTKKIKIRKQHHSLGRFSTFLEKEIFEQPDAIRDTTRGRFGEDFSSVVLGGISSVAEVKRVLFLGCGTAFHAGYLGKYYMENIAKIPASVEISSEYKYKNNPTEDGTLVVAISQSGETIDTLSAVKEAQSKGLETIAITNTVMSSIARQVDEGIYQRIGPEISVASTKALTSQVVLVLMLAISLARKNEMSALEAKKHIKFLRQLPDLISQTLLLSQKASYSWALKHQLIEDLTFLGRQYMYPVALEGALKVRELTYIPTIGYTSGEMKHGPLASIDGRSHCVFLAPQKSLQDKNTLTMKEIKARGGKILLIKQRDQQFPEDSYDEIINIPQAPDYLLPVLSMVPLQLISLYLAQAKNLNIDKPRNLAKSVTVE